MLPPQSSAAPPEKNSPPGDLPDLPEHEPADKMEDLVPLGRYESMPIVGLGGSAGSIRALQKFFEAMPPSSGMAFVVVLHLAPECESTLPQLLGRATSMRVRAAQDADKVQKNCVYVIPPGKHHLGGWVPAAHPDGGREGQAGGGGSVLPLARRGLRTPRRGDRPVGGGRRWRARHQADKRARRPDHRPGSGGGRAPGHAASGHRHRDGRLGPPGGRDAAAARRIPRQRAAAAAAARGWAAAGAGAQDHPR